jgi:hypothetical protein
MMRADASANAMAAAKLPSDGGRETGIANSAKASKSSSAASGSNSGNESFERSRPRWLML